MNNKESQLNSYVNENLLGGISKKFILNLAGGKINPIFLNDLGETKSEKVLTVNIDRMYMENDKLTEIIGEWDTISRKPYKRNYYFSCDIMEFLTQFHLKFDAITIYRYLEHVKKNDILYFIYLLSTSVRVGGLIDVIVPDYTKLAHRIINENVYSSNFEEEDILTTYELLNEPYDPHASIWTVPRIYKFWTLEKRFQIDYLYDNYEFDGRDIYIRFIAKRVK